MVNKQAARARLDLIHRTTFQTEWPKLPPAIQLRIRELSRFPTLANHNAVSGFIAGYIAAAPGAFSDGFAQALAYAVYEKHEWALDEVWHARLSE